MDGFFIDQLNRLIIGLTDQEVVLGKEFLYDGRKLHADEVSDIVMPSVLCLAQNMSERLGLGSFGYEFSIGNVNPVFPITAKLIKEESVRFFQAAPFALEIFETDVLECRLDLARLFERAAKIIQPDYDLVKNTNYVEAVPAPVVKMDVVNSASTLGR